MHLDVISLKNIELSSAAFWNFIKRTKIWKRKFTKDQPKFFDESILSDDILLREQSFLSWDDHFKFKRLCLKLNSLANNWRTQNFIKKTYSISSKIGDDEKITDMNSNFLLTSTRCQFFNTIRSIYDINTFSAVKTFDSGPKYQVLSADFDPRHLVMFGEEQLVGGSASPSHDYNFSVKLYSRPRYQLVKRSVVFHEPEMTPWSVVRVCKDRIVVFVSNVQGRDLNSEDNQDSLHIFSFEDSALKYLKHEKRIVLGLPPRKYLSIFQFDSLHLIGCRRKNTLVEVWSLSSPHLASSCWVAPLTWSKDVSFGNLIKCSSVLLHTPIAFIGKSNGRCDLWDTLLDVRLRSVVHGESHLDHHLLVSRIVLTERHLVTLTSQGKVFLWDRSNTEELGEADLNKTDPVWTVASQTRGSKIVDLFCDETKLVTVESGPSQEKGSVVMYDFWHSKNKTNHLRSNSKRSYSDISSSSKKRICN